MFCMSCGKKLPEGARFCTDCGYAVLPVQFADAGNAPAAEPIQPEVLTPAPEPPVAAAPAAEPIQPEVLTPAPEPPVAAAPAPGPIQPEILTPAPQPAVPAPAPRGKGKPWLRWLVYAAIAAAAFALGMLVMTMVRKADASEAHSPESTVGAGKAAVPVNTPQPTEAAEQTAAAAAEAAPPMTLADLDFDPPIYEEGETLYIGRMQFDWAEQSTIAFILSADGAEVRNIEIHNKNMDFDLPESGGHVSDWTVTEEFAMSFPYTTGTAMDMGRCRLDGVVIDGDRASAVLTYSYFYRSTDGSVEETVELGSAPVEFVRYDAAYGAAAQERAAAERQTEETAGTASAVVRFEDKEYVCTIGDIRLSDAYQQTVTIEAAGIGSVIPIRNNKLIVPVQASIVAFGETYEWTQVSTTADSLTFTFDTTADPQQIVLYPFGGEDDESAWAVYDVAKGAFTQLF